MKKILIILGFLLACSVPASAQIVVGGTNWHNGGTTTTLATTIAPTNGTTIIVVCAYNSTSVTVTSLKDNNNVSLTQDVLLNEGVDTEGIWHESNVTGVTGITIIISSAANVACNVIQVSGLAPSSPGDVFSGAAQRNGAAPWSSGSITTSNANDIVVGVAYNSSATAPLTNSGSWTVLSGAFPEFAAMIYQVVSSAQAWNPTAASSGGTFGGLSGSFKQNPQAPNSGGLGGKAGIGGKAGLG